MTSPDTRRVALAIGVSAAALGAFALTIEPAALATALRSARPGWIAAAAAVLLFEFALRAARWRLLLVGAGRARLPDLFAAQTAGAAASVLLPFRAGELVKPLVAARRSGLPLGALVTTAVLERLYDLLGLSVVLVVMGLALPEPPPEEGLLVANLKRYGTLFGLAGAGGLGLVLLLARRPALLEAALTGLTQRLPPPVGGVVLRAGIAALAALGHARHPPALLGAAALSVWLWLDGALAIHFLFSAFDMGLPFGAACFTAVAIALTVAVPQAPGFVGVFQLAMQKTMLLWGQPQGEADAFALVFWAVSFLPVTLVGTLAFWREGFRPGRAIVLGPAADSGGGAPPG